jgi:hypothetical protein
MEKRQMVCLLAGCLASSGQAHEHWGLVSGYSKEAIRIQGRGMMLSELPNMPVELPQRPIMQRDWEDLINCGDMLAGLSRASHYVLPAPQFFYRIDDDHISVFTPYFAGVDKLRCQRHTFGIKYRETRNVCYMAIPYRSPLRRPETWGFYYTASAIDSWWNGAFATGGPFSYFHEVDRQSSSDAKRFPDSIHQPRAGSINFMNQKAIPFQMHPRARELWGPELSLDREPVSLFIRYLTQMATVAEVSTETGSAITIDQIDKGLDTCTGVANRVGLSNLGQAMARMSVQVKPRIAIQRERNAGLSLDVKALQKAVRRKEILAVEAIVSNHSHGPFDTDGDECTSPIWSIHPKDYFSHIHTTECHVDKALRSAIGSGGKNLRPWEDKLTIRSGVIRSFILHLEVNEFAKPGPLEFSLSFGRRNPIGSQPQKIRIVGEGK